MKRYDPEVPPDAAAWLALDEQHRIDLTESYHRTLREKVPKLKAHATIHAIVENQIAEGVEPVVRAMGRLMGQGLSRHEALHVVGTVLAEHIYDVMNSRNAPPSGTSLEDRYEAAVERITAQEWRRKHQ